MKCSNCGAEMEEGAVFCSKCGSKIETETNTSEMTENPTNTNDEITATKKNKRPLIIALVVVVLLAVGAVVNFAVLNSEYYLSKGYYQKAYSKAMTDEDKWKVVIENLFAICSNDLANRMKDPSSFKLEGASILNFVGFSGHDDAPIVTLYSSAENSYGSRVYNLYFYYYEDSEWHFVNPSVWEGRVDYDTIADAYFESGYSVGDDQIDRINVLIENENLDDVVQVEDLNEVIYTFKAWSDTGLTPVEEDD